MNSNDYAILVTILRVQDGKWRNKLTSSLSSREFKTILYNKCILNETKSNLFLCHPTCSRSQIGYKCISLWKAVLLSSINVLYFTAHKNLIRSHNNLATRSQGAVNTRWNILVLCSQRWSPISPHCKQSGLCYVLLEIQSFLPAINHPWPFFSFCLLLSQCFGSQWRNRDTSNVRHFCNTLGFAFSGLPQQTQLGRVQGWAQFEKQWENYRCREQRRVKS